MAKPFSRQGCIRWLENAPICGWIVGAPVEPRWSFEVVAVVQGALRDAPHLGIGCAEAGPRHPLVVQPARELTDIQALIPPGDRLPLQPPVHRVFPPERALRVQPALDCAPHGRPARANVDESRLVRHSTTLQLSRNRDWANEPALVLQSTRAALWEVDAGEKEHGLMA